MEENEELITSEEMSALLPEVPASDAAREREKRRRVTPYNFRRPDRLSKEQIRALYLQHDLFAHSLSTSLPLFMRAVSEVNLISVEQQSYGDYLKGLADPTTIFTIAANSLRGVYAVEFNSSIAFPVIDRMLGGEGKALGEKRPATELELKVLEGFLSVINERYRDVWSSVVEFDTEIMARETRPQMLQIVPPNEIVAAAVYQVQIGDATGLMSICLPVAMLEPIIDKFNQSQYAAENPTPPETTFSLLQAVSNVRFPVSAQLSSSPSAARDLMGLAVGDVLKTTHALQKPIDICVADSVKFTGRLAAIDGKKVAQVTEAGERRAGAVAAI